MSEQDSRLAMAELKLEQHERLHIETQSSIRVLSDGINQLVKSEIRREQDKETFNRIGGEIASANVDLKKMRTDFEEYKDAQMAKELEAYKGIVLKVAGLVTLIIASVIAGHYGSHLLG